MSKSLEYMKKYRASKKAGNGGGIQMSTNNQNEQRGIPIPEGVKFDNNGYNRILNGADDIQKPILQNLVRDILPENNGNETYTNNIDFSVNKNGVIIVRYDSSEFSGRIDGVPKGITTRHLRVGINGRKNGATNTTPEKLLIMRQQQGRTSKTLSKQERAEIREQVKTGKSVEIKKYL